MKLEVNIKYHDKAGGLLREEDMPLEDYAVLLRNGQQRVIGDVERLIYTMNGNKPRDEWDTEIVRQYALIRRQLLDTAGDIGRLPEDIHEHIQTIEEKNQTFWNKMFS